MNNFKKTTLSLVTAVAIGFTGCGSSSTDAGVTTDNTPLPTDTTTNNTPSTDTTLPASITTDMHLTSDKVWLLDGKVIVSNNATLTIDAGTTIAGNTPASFLAIAAGSKLNAIGTLDKPITFTSKKDVDGLSSDNSQGEWGGLILAGNAYTHYSNNVYEADPTINFGSADHAHDGDSSGDLEYVAIKHTGFKVSLDKELNGLSLAGVGSGTKIENIAIIGGADDAIEIWGGTVNLKNVYLYNGSDDSVDTDLGYRGTWENVLVQQVKLDSYNNHDSAAMETGNDGDTITTDDTNATQVHIINMTAYVKGADVDRKSVV